MLYENIQEAVEYITTITDFKPRFGIILGTGLAGLVDKMESVAVLDYEEIPHFLSPTVETHRGKLVFGFLFQMARPGFNTKNIQFWKMSQRAFWIR